VASNPTVSDPISIAKPPGAGRLERLRTVLGAWQPFTGGGIAAFSRASLPRTLTFQVLFALGLSCVIVWSVRLAWFPPFVAALGNLPGSDAGIRQGRLDWPEPTAVTLADNRQIALVVDPAGTGELGRAADLQIELRRDGLSLHGPFGHQTFPYPPDLELRLDRLGGTAAWGAWNWVGLALIGIATFSSSMALWWMMAVATALPSWLLALVARRALTLGGACLMMAAAWLPASLVLAGGAALYATSWIRLPGLMLAVVVHAVVAVLWHVWGFLNLPARRAAKTMDDPFGSSGPAEAAPGRLKKKNPFG